MQLTLTVDFHSHFIPPDLPDFGSRTGDDRWPRLVVERGASDGTIMRGGEVFRVVRESCWSPESRVLDMSRAAIDCEILSPIPVVLTYWADPKLALDFARHINDWLVSALQVHGGLFKGLGTVPLQDARLAVAEMERVMSLGLSGLEIGTVVGSHELSASELRPFFKAASDARVPLFVHPVDGDCATRARTQRDRFGIGMHTDTALAASSLVFDGVLEDCKDLRVCLSHGGGSFPWTYPRLRWQATRGSESDAVRLDRLVSRFYADALVFDPQHLPVLMSRYGAHHMVYGTDYPFLPRDTPPGTIFDQAEGLGICSRSQADGMLGENALRFVGASLSPGSS